MDQLGSKRDFFGNPMQDWEMPGNKPLNTLIKKLKALVGDQNPSQFITDPRPPVYLTYESVLAIFNEALADESWPANDKILSFSLPKTRNSSQSEKGSRAGPTGKRVRDDADWDDAFAMPPEPAPKRVQLCSPLCDEVSGADDEADGDAVQYVSYHRARLGGSRTAMPVCLLVHTCPPGQCALPLPRPMRSSTLYT